MDSHNLKAEFAIILMSELDDLIHSWGGYHVW